MAPVEVCFLNFLEAKKCCFSGNFHGASIDKCHSDVLEMTVLCALGENRHKIALAYVYAAGLKSGKFQALVNVLFGGADQSQAGFG